MNIVIFHQYHELGLILYCLDARTGFLTENVDYVFQKTAKNLLLSYSIISIMISTLSSFISQPSKIGKIANMQRVAIITLIDLKSS